MSAFNMVSSKVCSRQSSCSYSVSANTQTQRDTNALKATKQVFTMTSIVMANDGMLLAAGCGLYIAELRLPQALCSRLSLLACLVRVVSKVATLLLKVGVGVALCLHTYGMHSRSG